MDKKSPAITRKKFLEGTATVASLIAFDSLIGCTSFTEIKSPEIANEKDIILINCNVVDVINGKILSNKNVSVKNGHILAITDQTVTGDGTETIINLNGNYIIPGLIDAHCHTTTCGAAFFDPFGGMALLRQNKKNFNQHIVSGTTTVRDMGSFYNFFHDYLDLLDEGSIIGPRVVFCNQMINLKGSHPSFDLSDATIFGGTLTSVMGDGASRFTNSEELKKALKDNLNSFGKKRKPSFLKLTASEKSLLCGRDGLPMYSDEHIKIIRDFADQNKMPLAMHIHTKMGFDMALKIGIQSIEHMVGDAFLSDQDIKAMVNNKLAIVPTMCLASYYAADDSFDVLPEKYKTDFILNELKLRKDFIFSPQERYCDPAIQKNNIEYMGNYKKFKCEDFLKNHIMLPKPETYFDYLVYGLKNLKMMKSAGVLIGCGTDAGVPYVFHGTLWREMEFFTRAGFTNAEALKCATMNNAKILNMDDKIGSVEAGKFADLVVLSDNPFKKIETCREPLIVMKEGKILYTKNELKRESAKSLTV